MLNRDETARPTPAPAVIADGAHLLVVIDHRQARVFRTELRGTVPERVVPYDRDGLGRHLHEVEGIATGKRRPERKSFYEAVARTLRDAAEVVVFGHGTGASSAMEQLVSELTRDHPDIARRVVATAAVDGHLTDDQLLAKARTVYAGRYPAAAPVAVAPEPLPAGRDGETVP
jgi:hypothetical protein